MADQERTIEVSEQDVQAVQQKLEGWAKTLSEKECYLLADALGGKVEGSGDVEGYVFYDPRTQSVGVRRGYAPAGTTTLLSYNVPFIGRVTSLRSGRAGR